MWKEKHKLCVSSTKQLQQIPKAEPQINSALGLSIQISTSHPHAEHLQQLWQNWSNIYRVCIYIYILHVHIQWWVWCCNGHDNHVTTKRSMITRAPENDRGRHLSRSCRRGELWVPLRQHAWHEKTHHSLTSQHDFGMFAMYLSSFTCFLFEQNGFFFCKNIINLNMICPHLQELDGPTSDINIHKSAHHVVNLCAEKIHRRIGISFQHTTFFGHAQLETFT